MKKNILSAAALIALCGGIQTAESMQAGDVAAIVDRFVPYAALGLENGDVDSVSVCHRVFQQDAAGQPLAIAALYLSGFEGRLRVLVRSGGAFVVGGESAADLVLSGDGCSVGYEDLDADGAPELAVNVSRGINDTLWFFRWADGVLENITPTNQEDAGVTTWFSGAILVDVSHDGKRQVYAETRRVEPVAVDDEPGALYVRQGGAWTEDPECQDLWIVLYGGIAGPPHDIRGAGGSGRYFLKLVNGAFGGGQRGSVTSVRVGGVEVLAPRRVAVGDEFVEIPLGAGLTSGQLVEVTPGPSTPDALMTAMLLKR